MSELERLIIISVPPEGVVPQLQNVRVPLCEKYNAGWALRYPPHITLRTGLLLPEGMSEDVFARFAYICNDCHSFAIETLPAQSRMMSYEGEEHFFVYYPVVQNESLLALNRALLSYTDFRKSDKTSYHPHVTLFWGDVPGDEKTELTASISSGDDPWCRRFHWQCDNVCFYRYTGEKWIPVHRIDLS